jgi:hypothetical protein
MKYTITYKNIAVSSFNNESEARKSWHKIAKKLWATKNNILGLKVLVK